MKRFKHGLWYTGLVIGLMLLFGSPRLSYGRDKGTVELVEDAYKNGEIDYETSLIYKVQTIHHLDRIPAKYRAKVETIQKSATPILLEVKKGWLSLSPQTRATLKTLLTRPAGPFSYNSPEGHFKIHYDTTGVDGVPTADSNSNGIPDYVENLAHYADSSYRTEITYLGYRIPPSDGSNGGDSKYDIYTEDMPYYGYTMPEDPGPQPWNDYTSYISVHNNFIGFPPNTDPEGNQKGAMKVTVAHEYFHAVQFAYDVDEAEWFMELSSTWMETIAYHTVNDNYNYLPYFFNYPDVSLQATTIREYAAFIWNMYLSVNFGNDIIKDIWERCITGSAIVEIDNALTARISSRDKAFKEFTVWNYITGARNDGLHFPDAGNYPLIKLMRTHSTYPVTNNTSSMTPDNLSANYIQFNPTGNPVDLNIKFNGQTGYLWALKALGVKINGTYSYAEFEIPLDDTGYGEGSIPNLENYNYVILIPSVLSTSGTNLNYTYSAWLTPSDTVHKVDVTSSSDKQIINASTDTSYFYVQNTGLVTDTFSLVTLDKKGWLQNPVSFLDTLAPGEADTVMAVSKVPYNALVGTADTLRLTSGSLSNPLVRDSSNLILTIVAIRGDANNDGNVTVADAVFLIAYLFKGGRLPQHIGTGDTNCDGEITVADVIYLVNYLFKSGPPPCFSG
ncbi:MAG TPA: MXAN_6640 family putative metalloprotease [Terriglobales bacterium]|nr:MXAN_6640 family putative metalloprotease [Terriglobales bacterium]